MWTISLHLRLKLCRKRMPSLTLLFLHIICPELRYLCPMAVFRAIFCGNKTWPKWRLTGLSSPEKVSVLPGWAAVAGTRAPPSRGPWSSPAPRSASTWSPASSSGSRPAARPGSWSSSPRRPPGAWPSRQLRPERRQRQTGKPEQELKPKMNAKKTLPAIVNDKPKLVLIIRPKIELWDWLPEWVSKLLKARKNYNRPK